MLYILRKLFNKTITRCQARFLKGILILTLVVKVSNPIKKITSPSLRPWQENTYIPLFVPSLSGGKAVSWSCGSWLFGACALAELQIHGSYLLSLLQPSTWH